MDSAGKEMSYFPILLPPWTCTCTWPWDSSSTPYGWEVPTSSSYLFISVPKLQTTKGFPSIEDLSFSFSCVPSFLFYLFPFSMSFFPLSATSSSHLSPQSVSPSPLGFLALSFLLHMHFSLLILVAIFLTSPPSSSPSFCLPSLCSFSSLDHCQVHHCLHPPSWWHQAMTSSSCAKAWAGQWPPHPLNNTK